MSVVLLVLTIMLILPTVVLGQRAILSLGTKLKQKIAPSSEPEGKYLSFCSLACKRAEANSDFVFSSFVLLLLCHNIDDIVVKDGHVQAMRGLTQVDLAFEGLEMILDTGKNGGKQILDGSVRGRAQPGRMLAGMYLHKKS